MKAIAEIKTVHDPKGMFVNLQNWNSDFNIQCESIEIILMVFSYCLKHSQPDFTILVLQGVGLLDNNCTPLSGFLRRRIYGKWTIYCKCKHES